LTEREQQHLKKIDEKIAQMKAQQQTILARDKERQRKARTRRLIQTGALAEQYLNCKDMVPLEFEKMLKRIASCPEVGKIIYEKANKNQ